MSDRPRFIVWRRPNNIRRQRYAYCFNRCRYSLETLSTSGCSASGYARTFVGAWLGAIGIPTGEALHRLRLRSFPPKRWSL